MLVIVSRGGIFCHVKLVAMNLFGSLSGFLRSEHSSRGDYIQYCSEVVMQHMYRYVRFLEHEMVYAILLATYE